MLLHHCLLPYKAIGNTSVGNRLHSGFTHQEMGGGVLVLGTVAFQILFGNSESV